MNKIKLSICIPTYNGAKSIKSCLLSVFKARNGFEEVVEVIVSDNCSIDNTCDILNTFNEKNFRKYTNKENIGYNKNLFLLIEKYALGDFVWTIGDDDYISEDSIRFFLKYYNQMDLLLMKNKITSNEKIESEIGQQRSLKARKMSYFEAIDNIASGSNLLATFMSCAIFRKNIIANIDKTDIQMIDWYTYPRVFPNGYLLYSAFYNNENVFSTDEYFIFNIPLKREWADKMILIQSRILPEFYIDMCKTKRAIVELKRTRYMLIKSLIKILIKVKDKKYKKMAIMSLKKIISNTLGFK